MNWKRFKGGWSRKELLAIAILLLIALIIALISGCAQSKTVSQGNERQRRTVQEDGVQGGVPFTRTMTETVEIDKAATSETKSGLDEAAVARIASGVVAAALKGATGGISGEGIAAVAGIGTTLTASVLAFLKSREAKMHKADSDEAWGKLVSTSVKV